MKTRPVPPQRRELDANGRGPGERLSEYFDFTAFPEKRDLKVKRGELLAILTRQWAVERESRWYRLAWKWLKARTGSGPVKVAEPGATDGD